MERVALIEHVRQVLARAGFAVSERCDLRPVSFDLVARRDKDLLIVKVLGNVDALAEPTAQEMKVLCKFLHGRPVLVGLRSGTGILEEGVVYARHDIPIVHPATLEEYILGGQPPMVFAAPGGFYVRMDTSALRQVRQELAISLGTLAQIAGVSRRAIQMYEEGMSASIDAAMRLEEYLETDLIQPVDPFASFDRDAYQPPPPAPEPEGQPDADPMEALVLRLLKDLGYQVHATKRSPFNALTTEQGRATSGTPAASGPDPSAMLTGLGRDSPQLRRRARIVASVSGIVERPGFFVLERTNHTNVEGMPVVSRTELRRLTDPERILELILERQGAGREAAADGSA
ncbi:MAG: transcriptional regulator [Thermoplasmatota archaeon]